MEPRETLSRGDVQVKPRETLEEKRRSESETERNWKNLEEKSTSASEVRNFVKRRGEVQ